MELNMIQEGSGFNDTMTDNASNQTLCAARSLDRHFTLPLSSDELAVVASFQFLYFFALVVLGTTLNFTIVWTVIKHKKLQTLDIAIAVQIVIISLATILVVLIPALVNIVASQWIFGPYACSTLGFIEHTLRSTRRSLMVALALDRFLLVFMPFKYPKHHCKVVIILSAISWIGTILFRLTGLPGLLDCYRLSSANIFCSFIATCSSTCMILGYLDFVIIHAPFYIMPTILYGAMYIKGRRITASNKKVRADIDKGSYKAHITFFLLFLTSVLCNLPNIGSILVLQIVVAVQGFSVALGVMLFVLAHSLFVLVVLDAIVILRNQHIKEVVAMSWKEFTKKLCQRKRTPALSK